MSENVKIEAGKSSVEEFEAILRRAENRMDCKDYGGALKWYTKAIEINPNDPWSYWERGLVKKAKNEIDAAIRDFDMTITLQPDNAFAYFQRALLKEKKKDKDAEADFEKAQQIRASQPQRFKIEKAPLKTQFKTSFEKDGRSGNDFTQDAPVEELSVDDTVLTDQLLKHDIFPETP